MQIEITDRLPAELDELAQHSPEATFYQTSTWIDGLDAAFDSFRTRSLVARDGGRIAGYLPYIEILRAVGRQLWSLPFGTYGGPVARGNAQAARALVDAFVRLRTEKGTLEVGLVDFGSQASHAALRLETASTQVIRLPDDFDELWGRFDKSKRRQTRKAERDGIAVAESRDRDETRAYYDIYTERCRAWGQPLVYPFELFDRLVSRGEDSVRLFLANDGDRIIGGHLNFYFRDTVIAWNGVTAEHERASQASTLLYSACLRHACEGGYQSYNLGASLGKESLEDYKRALGGEQVVYRTGRWRSLRGRLAAAIRRITKR
jgi:CelD/BcsL family acetyltransferase involved in cellulose biosynthesis